MPRKYITADIASVLASKSRAGITFWNRLEGRPRAEKFDRALRAEVRDALWMLTRQWQMGEFQGDDAGSPIVAKVRIETTRIRTYQAAHGSVEAFDDGTPLEARVERMPIPFVLGGHEVALDIRLLMGRYWLKLIDTLEPAARPQYVARYPVHAPDPSNAADAPTVAHQEAWSTFAAAHAAGLMMDGAKLYDHLTKGGGQAADGIPSLAGRELDAAKLGRRFVRWFETLIAQPAPSAAWEPDRLEYRFACSAPDVMAPIPEDGSPAEKVLVAEEYYQGHLDWYNLDVDRSRRVLGDPGGDGNGASDARTPLTLSMLPTQVSWNGMPSTRWWEFEDQQTNFGDIKPDTTDLAKLLLIEFGLVYANDWFLIPFTVPAGSIAAIRGMAVTNVFGERTWIEAAGRGDDDDWQRWAMFLLSIKGSGHEPADTSLVILPVAQQVLEGRPLEDVMLARDEMANMVWAIEKAITLPSGEPKPGSEAAYETRAFFLRDFERRHGHLPQSPPLAEGAKIRYRVMSDVPEHWIPMIPVHVDGDNREVQLQRAAMLRILEGDSVGGQPVDPSPVRPRTSLLRVGLDGPGPATRYLVHEEEVPRAGIRVTQAFQRTRWRDGRAWVWLGIGKQTGRGEGSSGLAFDRIVDAGTNAPSQPR
jgi:hypothetical protein